MNRSIICRTVCALAVLALGLGTPARGAGMWDFLIGAPETPVSETPAPETPAPETPAPETPAPETTPSEAPGATLPPVDVLWGTDTPAPSASLAPIPSAAIEDDGVLRVELRSLGALPAMNLRLAGIYAVDGDPGFRFERGTRVALTAEEGEIYLGVGGLILNMGREFTLTRHRAAEGDENGIYIDESENDALYCGDMTLSAEGAALRAVLRVQVEDYLYGVVAYEMSDSFPIEALKAQAVAARTYAMQRKWQAGGRDYDLVDTTADQVFKGYVPGYDNVVRAVDETRGVVGMYNGGFAICYYTASNGGQTALPSQIWGQAGSDGYLDMRYDPYDLENPRSLLNDLTVTARCEGSAELKAMLEDALGKRLAQEGFGDGEWALDSIAAIEPVNPRFEGSEMCDGLAFSLRARLLVPIATPEPTDTPEPTATPGPTDTPEPTASPGPTPTDAVSAVAAALIGDALPTAPDEPLPTPTEAPKEWVLSDGTYTVVLDVYEQIKRGLSLGLNKADYELVSVETEAGESGAPRAFRLVMRRFGHGVGMSQRGAQWMAGHYGLSWRDILAFYYPGLSLERMAWPDEPLTELSALPGGAGAARPRPTATPSPAPLPELEAGEHYATVTATVLNLRESPTTVARVAAQLARGRRVIVSSAPDADGWVRVRTAELEGYVKEEYLERE